MADEGLKINRLKVEHFRGIPNEVSLDFTSRGEAESALIFGDNGSGKSSIADAVEFVTQGSIQGNQSGNAAGWIYNSVSLEKKETACISIRLNNEQESKSSFSRNEEEQKIDASKKVIDEFRYAPFVLRRMDILNFWSEQSQKKLMLFFKYVKSDTEEMVATENEMAIVIEQERIRKKTEKRALIEEICKFYKLKASELVNKNKGDFRKYKK